MPTAESDALAASSALPADEHRWREMPAAPRGGGDGSPAAPGDPAGARAGIVIGRWLDRRIGWRELVAPVSPRHYTISLLLGPATIDCYKDGRLLERGTGGPGGLQLTAPGEHVQCRFRGANEALHMFVPAALVDAEYDALDGSGATPRLEDPGFRVDPVLMPLARRLAACAQEDARQRDGVVAGILHHVLTRYAHEPRRSRQGLAAPKLRRVIDYVDANFAEPITLHDIARHAGLSRMHFAAQFRLATGLTPHAYLTRRRVEQAKTLLRRGLPIVEVALASGFAGQAHFSTVFREATGLTPRRWRLQSAD
ncbi:AraC family transcriptional regulator [Burkholderia gladioli]|uniref:AraC family transcriptional regulator n=1 Tax=Burkholderia gladioli TaxID=28095 RepID=UPI001364D216|nr:AraC family transcriptional regulator [Burkholderia gladioli]KAF1058260.1 HTH-type transcriptional activator RhaR [Burkholderia gladioli]WAG22459.1 AraC family transcriptional regulator [Burkholderia gladioli]